MKSTIKIVQGNVLDYTKDVAVIHGVNCQGVMGSGVALAIKNAYPKVYTEYKRMCYATASAEDVLGRVGVVTLNITDNFYVINGFTQIDCGTQRRQVSYDAIVEVFESTNRWLHCQKPLTLYFPKIGAGLGGGNWDIIKAIIESSVDQKFNPTLVDFVQ